MIFRKKQPVENIRISRLDLPAEFVLLDVPSLRQLEALRDPDEPFLESDSDVFLIKEAVAYRYQKPEALPRILKVERLELNPDSNAARVQLSVKELFAFAICERLFIFETQDGYYIPSDVVMFALKEKSGEKLH